jgi:K+-transporting ATPase KdpF subunit
MPSFAIGCEERRMLEPALGLIVSLLLGGYLLFTLIRPERF